MLNFQNAKLPLPPPPKSILPFARRSDLWRGLGIGIKVPRPPVPRPKDLARRRRAWGDQRFFLETYFPHRFWEPNEYHLTAIRRSEGWILTREPIAFYKAEAAPRGIGKTTLRVGGAILWGVLNRHLAFPLIMGANNDKAAERSQWIKRELLENELLMEDFPEVCGWVRSFGGDPQRCKPPYAWSDSMLQTPFGWTLAAAGWKSAIRGLIINGQRPDYILMDDLGGEGTARSESDTEYLVTAVTRAIGQLHDRARRAIYEYICTVAAGGSVEDQLTDPKLNPEWRGERWKGLLKPPDRADLWDEALEIHDGKRALPEAAARVLTSRVLEVYGKSESAFSKLTPGHQDFLRFYALHKDAMDAGAVVLDPVRLPLHELYHIQAGPRGKLTFATEIQQEPPKPDAAGERFLDVDFLNTKRAAEPAGFVPNWASALVATVDVGQYRLHWEVDAWDADFLTSQVCECGIEETQVNQAGRFDMASGEAERAKIVGQSLRATLDRLRLRFDRGLPRGSGEILKPALVVIDCGGAAKLSREKSYAWYRIVLEAAREFGPTWQAVQGDKFSEAQLERASGRNWIREAKNNPFGRIDANSVYYKLLLLEAWLAPPKGEDGGPLQGTRLVHAHCPPEYLRHQTAEKLEEGIAEGKPVEKAYSANWVLRSRDEGGHAQNHWWDTGWMQFFAADRLRERKARPGPKSLREWFGR